MVSQNVVLGAYTLLFAVVMYLIFSPISAPKPTDWSPLIPSSGGFPFVPISPIPESKPHTITNDVAQQGTCLSGYQGGHIGMQPCNPILGWTLQNGYLRQIASGCLNSNATGLFFDGCQTATSIPNPNQQFIVGEDGTIRQLSTGSCLALDANAQAILDPTCKLTTNKWKFISEK